MHAHDLTTCQQLQHAPRHTALVGYTLIRSLHGTLTVHILQVTPSLQWGVGACLKAMLNRCGPPCPN